jgi:serine/threonine protein kinase
MGERFGRYELLRKIATGGMAELFLARAAGPEGFEKLLVVKLILPHLAASEEFVDMFLHEARVAVRLSHPNIVQIFDLGEAEGTYFIAMEYIHGDDVRRLWKRSVEAGIPIPVPLACRIACDAAAGLDYAHKMVDSAGRPLQIIHRDVSPQNLLVSFEGAVKVADFGIAKASDRVSHTRTGVVKGKYSYMSPEQAAGKAIDQKTDQFALGVVLYELLTRKRLFKRPTEVETITAVAECKVLPPSQVDPRVPDELDRIVLTALARRPEDRYPDLAAMRQALEDWFLAERQPGSTAHLQAYLSSLYADRLERERASGGLLLDAEPSSSASARRRGASASRRARAGRAVWDSEPAGQVPRDSKLVSWAGGFLAVLAGGAALLPLARAPRSSPRGAVEAAAALGEIRVETAPPGARVLLDAKELSGRTPTAAGHVPLGDHQGVAALDGDRDETRSLRLQKGGEVALLSVPLSQTRSVPPPAGTPSSAPEAHLAGLPALGRPAVRAAVEITSEPSGTLFDEDEQATLGSTPFRGWLPVGRHALVLSNRGQGLEHRFALEVKAEGPNVKHLEFEQGEVQIVVKPVTMGADIYLGGRKLGSAPLKRFSLPEGEYQLTVVNEELKRTRKVAVSVRAGELSKKTVDLTEE